MKRMSRRGWNNVIILVVLVMIVILRTTDDRFFGRSSEAVEDGLLPDEAVVLAWQGPGWQIERLGHGWRSVPDLGRDGAGLQALLDQWQALRLVPAETAVQGSGLTMRVWVAGSNEPVSLIFFQDNGQYAVSNWRGRLLALSEAQYRQLLGGGR